MPAKPITVDTTVRVPVAKAWEYWIKPEHITRWAFASDDWEAPAAKNDLREGGTFTTTMAAKDKSASFDVTGTYNKVRQRELIEYTIEDGRKVSVKFQAAGGGTKITETFEPESENPEDMQRGGWQALLNNFKKYAEAAR
jgi:uncharacterized protein YndB with AHSA1/START domain